MKIVLILVTFYFSLFGLSLQEAEQRAKTKNSDVLIQKKMYESSKLNIEVAKAKRYGSVDLISSYTRYNTPRALKPLAPATSEKIINVGASYSVILFDGFSNLKEVNISKIQNELQNSMITLTINQVLYNVRTIYLDVLSLKKQKNAKLEYKKALDILRKNINKEVELGKRAKVDSLKVNADLQNLITELSVLDSNINILKSSLAVLINYEDDFEVIDIEDLRKNELLENDYYFNKIENLSTYKLTELNYQKAVTEYQKTKASYYPKITANTQYTKVYSGEGDDDKIWQAGLNLNWKVFDFGRTSSLVQKARIAQSQSLIEIHKRKLELKQNITESINRIKQNKDAYLGSVKEFSFTKETEKIEKIRYEQEAIDIYTYLFAKSSNAIVESKKILAKYNLLKSYYYLDYILEESK